MAVVFRLLAVALLPCAASSRLRPGLRATRQRVAVSARAVLTEDERAALIDASTAAPFCSTGSDPLTQATPTTWAAVRTRWPVLSQRSDAELASAYVDYLRTPPSLLAVLTKTPLGPFLLLWGFNWQELLGRVTDQM